MRRWLMALGLASVVSCAVGPDFAAPEIELPKSFTQNGVTWKRRSPDALPKSGAWWESYRDAGLTRLVELAIGRNQSLEAARAKVDEARALSLEARSLYFPNVEIDAGASRSQSRFRGPAGGITRANAYDLPLDLSYEVDLWGKVRRQAEGAQALESAAEESLRAMHLSIAGEVVYSYWALRAVDADRALMSRTLEIRRQALDLLGRQQAAGAISGFDYSRARSEVASVEADRIRLDQQRVELTSALAVLTGRMATDLRLVESRVLPEPPAVPVALPSEVIFQRPDVRASLHRVAAANADIGVATAAMYPALSINASAGLDSKQFSQLFSADALVWSLGSNLLVPLSAQHLLRHQREGRRAAHRAASADYRQAVLESVSEIETALQVSVILKQRLRAQQEALDAAKDTYDRSTKRFKEGMVSLFEVVDAERSLLSAERNMIAVRAEALAVSVSLIKAVGGTW